VICRMPPASPLQCLPNNLVIKVQDHTYPDRHPAWTPQTAEERYGTEHLIGELAYRPGTSGKEAGVGKRGSPTVNQSPPPAPIGPEWAGRNILCAFFF